MKYKITRTEEDSCYSTLISNTSIEEFSKISEQSKQYEDLEETFKILFEQLNCYEIKSKLLTNQVSILNRFTSTINIRNKSVSNSRIIIKNMVMFLEEEVLHLIEAYDDYINGLYCKVWGNIREQVKDINFDNFNTKQELQLGIFNTEILEAGFTSLQEIVRLGSLAGTMQTKINENIDILVGRHKKDKSIVSLGMIAKQHLNGVKDLTYKCTIPSLVTYCEVLTDEICEVIEPRLTKSLCKKSAEQVMRILDCTKEQAEELMSEETEIKELSELDVVLDDRNLLSYKDLNRLAREQGYDKVRQRGDHGIFKRLDGSLVVIPQGRMVGKGLNLKIQKDLAR